MSIFSYLKRHAVISSVVTLSIVIITIIAGRAISQQPAVENTNGSKKVNLVRVSEFRKGNAFISVDGTVEAKSQADLRSQMSAPVSVVYAQVGGTISKGQVILELQNADIKAQLEQARSALQLAKGQQSTGAVSLTSAKQGAIDKLREAYIKSYEIIYAQVDPMLYNNDNSGGRFSSYIGDSKLNSEIIDTNIDVKSSFMTWKNRIDSLNTDSSSQSIEEVLSYSQNRLSTIDKMLGSMAFALNETAKYANSSLTGTINGWKAIVSNARSSITGAITGITASQSALTSSNTAQSSTVPAQVAAAQAGVNNLEAQFAKTIVRSPITGKISALPLRVGELASPGTLVATVVGEGELQIKSFASGDDLARIKVGAPVTIQENIKGTVSNVSPSVDAISKKAQVDIDITDSKNSALIVGQNVTASIAADNTSLSSDKTTYTLPIQNVKIVPGSAYVFTVNPDSKIQKHEVILGEVKGDFVQVKTGLTDDMMIVSPVYELDEGQTVEVH